MKKNYLIAVILTFVLSSCFNSEERKKEKIDFAYKLETYGVKFNEQRIKYKIPIIPNNWKSHVSNKEHMYSRAVTKLPIGEAGLSTIVTNFNGTEFLFEEAMYYGSSYFTTPEGRFRELVSVYYSAKDTVIQGFHYKENWNCFLRSKDVAENKLPHVISFHRADSILKVWGIKRLNY